MTTTGEAPATPLPAREAVEVRVGSLRAELEATDDPARQAVLRYEIGHLLEGPLRDEAAAVREYLEAYNTDSTFRPPLFALVRLFERRRSLNNLGRLYEAEARSAPTGRDCASALVDQGVLVEDTQPQQAQAQALFTKALELDPTHRAAALMLERAARRAGDEAATLRAVEARAHAGRDPVLKGLLLVDAAHARERAGDVDGAVALMREAAAQPAARWRLLEQLERLARRQGRTDVLVDALEERAALAVAAARGEQQGQDTGTFSVQRLADADQAAADAAALWHAAAHLRFSELGDAAGAARALDRALELRPNDPLLRQDHMLTCELAGELEAAAADAAALLQSGVDGAPAAALHVRRAELAKSRGDVEAARTALSEAFEADRNSAAALAMLDDLLLEAGAHQERVERLEERAEQTDGRAQGQALWRAAQVALEHAGDFDRARTLYRRAAEAFAAEGAAETPCDEATAVLRELYAAARGRGEPGLAVARDVGWQLLDHPLDEDEHSALLFDLLELTRQQPSEHLGPDTVLRRALQSPATARWAPDAARLHAAWQGDLQLLAQAHRALADNAPKDDVRAAHLCGAARALLRTAQEDAALEALQAAIDAVPGHRYAVAMLEELLRARGEADRVVELLRDAAAAQEGAHSAEASLLLAGAAAEAAGDTRLAAQTYQDAAEQDPTWVAPLWSLRRLAERTGDRELLTKALEALSEREIASGDPGRTTLELAELQAFVDGDAARAEGTLRAALEGPQVSTAGAAALMALPDRGSDAPLLALERVLERTPDDGAEPLLHELLLSAACNGRDLDRAERTGRRLAQQGSDERWSALGQLLLGSTDAPATDRADAWLALGQITGDPGAAAAMALHGLRAKSITAGADAADDAFIVAYEMAEQYPEHAASAAALDETVGGGDDPEARAQAYEARLKHSGREGIDVLRAAHGRCLLAAGRNDQALPLLQGALERDPDDLASWEALRVAAREAEAWEQVVQACDKLADSVDGALQAQLLEEAGAVLMDDLGKDAEAEGRLRRAFELDVTRPIAYGRLHDLLAEREDTTALLDIVSRRAQAIEDAEQLERLHYERARLLRSEGDRDRALEALEQLLLLNPVHEGGLALAVEINVSLERYADAVDKLRQLSAADVPGKQKRLALLGAADFLERKLGDPEAAVAELAKVDELGLGDAALYGRIADVAERAGKHSRAVEALDEASKRSQGAQRAQYARRAARLRGKHLDDQDGAIAAYRRALGAVPTDLESAESLAELLVDPTERKKLADDFERAARHHLLGEDPTSPEGLRALRAAAGWRKDRLLEHAALNSLVALGLATPQEREAEHRHTGQLPEVALGRELGEEALKKLRAPGDGGMPKELTQRAFEALAQCTSLDPAAFGVGKGELISSKHDHPLRDEVHRIAAAFGLPAGDFYVGGEEPGRVAVVVGRRERPAWIVGQAIKAPLDPRRRFDVARLAMAMRERTLPFVDRPPTEAADLLLAAAAAADAPLSSGSGRAGVQQWTPALGKALPRRARRSIAELAATVNDGGAGIPTFCRAARRTAARAGLMVAGNLTAALEHVLAGTPPERDGVRRSEDARDLLRFWLSPVSLALRAELGTST